MKKIFLFLSSAVMVLVLMVLAVSAASTVFTDEADADFTKVKEKVGTWQFEDNQDVEKTLYSKGLGMLMQEISLIYELSGPISAFKVDTLNCSGIGDSTLDVAAYVSADGSSWTTVETSVTDQVMDDAYISPDIAYWFNSAVSNKNAVPAGMKFLKVSLLPFDRQGMVNWATVIDKVSITYEGAQATPVPSPTTAPTTAPTIAPTEPPVSSEESSADVSSEVESEEISSTEEISQTESDVPSDESKISEESQPSASEADPDDKNNTPLLIGGIALAVIVVGAVVLFLVKRNKSKA